MSTVKLFGLGLLCFAVGVTAEPLVPRLGKTVPKTLLNNWNQDVFPDGWGLPKGRGNAEQGEQVYEKYCQHCHGYQGTGGAADELAGAHHGLADEPPDKTIGTYWPYATTVFDFTRRSMPLEAPGSLSDDQVYAVTAYLLYLNGIIDKRQEISAANLYKINMPNQDGFINVYHNGP